MNIDFHGVAPKGSSISVLDGYGNIVAETKAGNAGDWAIEASAPGGTFHAVVTIPGGRVIESETVAVAEAEADEIEADAEADDAIEADASADEHYQRCVELMARNGEAEWGYVAAVLELCGRTFDDLQRDVAAMQEIRERYAELVELAASELIDKEFAETSCALLGKPAEGFWHDVADRWAAQQIQVR